MHVLSIFAKDPRPGTAKTRLARSIGERHALDIAKALLTDTLQLADEINLDGSPNLTTSVFHTPDDAVARDRFRELAPRLGHEAQKGDDLGQRMKHCFDIWFGRDAERVVIIGTDCPMLSPEDIHSAFAKLDAADVVIGPASDGGYVLIGLSSPQPKLFENIDWGGPDVLAQTVSIVRRESLSLRLLPVQCDLDRVEDVRPVYGLLDAGLLTMRARGQATYWTLQDILSRPAFNPPRYEVAHFDEMEAVNCPCGLAKRAWSDTADFPSTVHQTQITLDAEPHYHKGQTEVYVILECAEDAAMELDGEFIPVRVGTTVMIRPGCVHRAVGEMRVLIVCNPKFDPADEFTV